LNALLALCGCCGTVGWEVARHRREVSQADFDPPSDVHPSKDREFIDSLAWYCKALIAELDRYDREVNWSDRELSPLEAEVEIERTCRLRPQIAPDLVEAIRQDRAARVFVVLGDPGSGKSVSLR
jgi:hypothetical protein